MKTMPKNIKFEVLKDNQDDIRPFTKLVRIEHENTIYTNGHYMLIAENLQEETNESYVEQNKLSSLIKLSDKKADNYKIKETTCNIYPNYKAVMPDPEDCNTFTVALNAKYLANLARAMNSDIVELRFSAANKAFYVLPTNTEKVFGLLMPARTNEDRDTFLSYYYQKNIKADYQDPDLKLNQYEECRILK